MARLLLLTALGVALTTPVRAEIPAALDGKPITEVEVAGEVRAIAEAREVGVPLGAPLNRALVRGAIERLLSSGRFTDVQIDAEPIGEGVRLVVRLQPRIELLRIQISGNEHVESNLILDALRLAPGSEIAVEQLPELSRAITASYAERGYLAASATLGLRDTDDPSRKVLMIEISEGRPTRIAEVVFDGEQPPNPARALAAMPSGVGDVLDRRKLVDEVAAVERYLRERGFLEATLQEPLVTIGNARARVVIRSRIGPRYSVAIMGEAPFQRADVREALNLHAQRLIAPVLKNDLPERVRDLYARSGFEGTEVRVDKARGEAPGTAVLLVRIAPGRRIRVAAVSFAGAQHFDRDFLEDQLFSYLSEKLPGSSVSRPIDSEVADELLHGSAGPHERQVPEPLVQNPEETFYPQVYEEAIKHIEELYQAEGYLSARVGPARLERIGRDRAAVLIPVVEGPRTRLHGVVVEGTEEIGTQEVLASSGLMRDQAFSYVALEQARLQIVKLYQERGYMFVAVTPTVRFSRDRTRAEVHILVVERFPVHVDRIIIRGAERTNESLVLRVMTLEPGDIFRPSEARESERQVASLGVFTGVSVAMQEPELPARVKSVIVTLSERRNQFLDFSAGLSTGQGARGGFEYGYRNLFGEAVSLTLRVQFAYQLFFVDREFEDRFRALEAVEDQLERRISLGASIPRTPGLGPVRTSIDLVHLRDNERDFGLDKNGVGLTFTHSPLEFLTLTLGGDLENNNVDLFEGQALQDFLAEEDSPRLRRLLRVPEGTSTLVAARTSASYDRRDSAFTPTRGYFVTATGELARTLTSDPDEFDTEVDQFISRFLKLGLSGSAYLPVTRSVVLAGQARIGRIFHLIDASQTYPNRAFFLGGVDTMRGFLEDELVPQDIAEEIIGDPEISPNTVVRAGDAFVLFRSELRFPLYGQLQGGLFADLGNLWAEPENLNPFQLRPTAGVGLRLATPVGPIALDYGFNLKRRAGLGERSGALHFSIGLF